MKKDAAIEEIRKVRHRISARYGHDTHALLKHYRRLEKRFADRMLKDRYSTRKGKARTTNRGRTRGRVARRAD